MLRTKRVKNFIALMLSVLLILVFSVGCGSSGQKAPNTGSSGSAPAEQPKKLKLVAAHVLAPTHHYQAAFEKMNEVLKEKTKGQIELVINHSAILGEEEEEIEGLQMGTINLATVSAAPLTGFVKEYMACDLPFMFSSPEQAYKFYDGPIGDELLKLTERIGLVGLAWWENGFRNFTNNVRPITTPADMKGMKIRTMNSPVHMASVKALGANPTVIPFGELYSALQQGVVDGEENPVGNIHANKFYEAQKYLTLSRHFYDPSPIFISKKTWDTLTDEQKKIMKEAAIIARDHSRKVANDNEAGLIKDLESKGMKVTVLTPDQVKAFQDATKDVYKDFVDKTGKDFLDKFLKAAGR
jgi:TRAP-type transport system periplasmic protein